MSLWETFYSNGYFPAWKVPLMLRLRPNHFREPIQNEMFESEIPKSRSFSLLGFPLKPKITNSISIRRAKRHKIKNSPVYKPMLIKLKHKNEGGKPHQSPMRSGGASRVCTQQKKGSHFEKKGVLKSYYTCHKNETTCNLVATPD